MNVNINSKFYKNGGKSIKRIFAVFLFSLLILGIVPTCYADSGRSKYKEQTVGQIESISDNEIVFRGMKFGTKYEDVKKAFENEGMIFPEPYWGGNDYARDGSAPRLFVDFADAPLSVAGHDMLLFLRFICLDKKDNVEVKPEDFVLAYAEYRVWDDKIRENISVNGVTTNNLLSNKRALWRRTIDDLSNKIQSIYGAPMSSSDRLYTDSVHSEVSWTDGHSKVKINADFYNTDGSCGIDIVYNWDEGFEQLQNNLNQSKKSSQAIVTPNTNGL